MASIIIFALHWHMSSVARLLARTADKAFHGGHCQPTAESASDAEGSLSTGVLRVDAGLQGICKCSRYRVSGPCWPSRCKCALRDCFSAGPSGSKHSRTHSRPRGACGAGGCPRKLATRMSVDGHRRTSCV